MIKLKKRITMAELTEIKHWCIEKQAISHHVVHGLCVEIEDLRDLLSRALTLGITEEAKTIIKEGMTDAR